MPNLAARITKVENLEAMRSSPIRLVIICRYVSPGDDDDQPTNFIVAQGKVWARADTEDEEAFIERVKAECHGRLLQLELRAAQPE